MGVFTCTKPATFAGVKYMPGDTVPAEAIPADRVGAVIRLGLIAEAQPAAEAQREPEPPATTTFTVPVTLEDGTVYDATVTPEAVVELVAVLQTTVEGATARVKAITDGTALILIDACDSRKTIKKAAAARAAELEGKPGRVMFEIAGVSEEIAREALRLASHKLPIKTKIVAREAAPEAEEVGE